VGIITNRRRTCQEFGKGIFINQSPVSAMLL
jgi:hypothetical protein